MRNVVGLLVAAAIGIHCSASAEPPEAAPPQTEAPEVVSPTQPPAATTTPAPAPVSNEAERRPTPATEVDRHLSALLEESATTQLTSTTLDAETGATYATGTFVGRVVIGNTVFESRGDKDVFLLKVDANGALQWVRAVGSAGAESAPRVALDGGARVNLIGMTTGRMDCGFGPLSTWSSATFFFCVFRSLDGTSLFGGVFPTGNP